MKKLSMLVVCALVLSCLFVPGAAQAQDAKIRFVDNTHVPQKLVVVHSYGTARFVKDLFNIVKEINESNQLSPAEQLKLHIISSGGDPLTQLGVSVEEAKKYAEVNPSFKSSDIWAQDCMEICSAVKPDGSIVQAVFDSKRGRGLAGLPKTLANLWNLMYFENPATSQAHGDYGGNLEVVPFENILCAGNTITAPCKNYLESKGYKGRAVYPDTSWLTVGHIDEYLMFIPSKNAPGGWSFCVADPIYGLDLVAGASDADFAKLNSSDRSFLMEVRKVLLAQEKDPEYGRGTSADNFIQMNRRIAEIIQDSVGKIKQFIRDNKGTPERDFNEVAWPCLFEGSMYGNNPRGCCAYLPGVVNLLVLRDHLVVPATNFPPYDKAIEGRFRAEGNHVHFVDDTPYHTAMGEIHCGTNVLRHPERQWITEKQVRAVQRVKDEFRRLHAPSDSGTR